MISMLRTLGAPVTEPLGNSAATTSASPAPSRSSDVTVDVSCHTVSYRSAAKTSSQRTVPGRDTRPRSLRSRSTIIAFSARSFAEAVSAAAFASSSSNHRPRGAVPFIGRVVTRRPSSARNSSGEADRTR
jgi:hypothetical protein